jgi:S1-C subfamily serine protease
MGLAGVVGAALILAPALSDAQSANDSGANLTRQTQNQIDIPLPSLAPLVELVMPAIVNISVELKEQAATQSQGDTGGMPGKTAVRLSGRVARRSTSSSSAFSRNRSNSAIRRKK